MAAPDHGTDGGGGDPAGLWERFLRWAQRPAPEGAGPARSGQILPDSPEDLEAVSRFADDRERLIGLMAAPIAGMIAVVITSSLIANDPKAVTAAGVVNKAHVAPSLYLEVGAVSLALALAMLATAWFRKRLYLGITMALYGLSVFNLHFWGFGVPFIIGGSWYLVRAYRIQQRLKTARAAGSGGGPRSSPGASKRYTPPRKRPPKGTPGGDRPAE